MTRAEIEQHTISFLRTAGGTRPDLRVIEIEGRRIVVKDFRRSAPFFRLLIGPLLIRRECGALIKLRDVDGFPKLIEKIDRYAMAIEHIDGLPLRDIKDPLPEGFFDKLTDVMRSSHGRGVAHCDLRSSGNVMITTAGEPRVVDFAACVMRGRGWNPLINFIFRQFAVGDLYAVLILKRKHSPDTLRPEEIERLATPLPYEWIAKKIGCEVRNITRKLLARRKDR